MKTRLLLIGLLVGCGSRRTEPAGPPPPTAQTQPAATAEADAGMIGIGRGIGYSHGLAGTAQPRFHIGEVVVSAGLVKEVVERYIRRNSPQLVACYDAARAKNPSLAGDIVIHFTIKPEDGTVADGVIVTGLDTGVDGCVADAVKKVEFPKPEGSAVTVSFPMTFMNPGDPPK